MNRIEKVVLFGCLYLLANPSQGLLYDRLLLVFGLAAWAAVIVNLILWFKESFLLSDLEYWERYQNSK